MRARCRSVADASPFSLAAVARVFGTIRAVIVEVGSFLGMGQKEVAIPWDSVERTMNDKGDDYQLHVSASKDALTDAPEYKSEARKY